MCLTAAFFGALIVLLQKYLILVKIDFFTALLSFLLMR